MDAAVQFSDCEEEKPNVNAIPLQPFAAASQRINESAGKYLPTDSSSSEHVLSSPEFEKGLDFQVNYMDIGYQDDPFGSEMRYDHQMSLFQDMFGFVRN